MTPEALGMAGAYLIKWAVRVALASALIGAILLAQIASVIFYN
jgi:hypothetical protein